MSSDRLFVGRRRHRGRLVITATGVLTRLTVMQLRTTLLETLQRAGPHLVLDLAGVSRIDDIGLEALRRTAARARVEDGDLHVAAAAPGVVARLRASGVAWKLSMHGSVAAAVEAAEAAEAQDGDGRTPDPAAAPSSETPSVLTDGAGLDDPDPDELGETVVPGGLVTFKNVEAHPNGHAVPVDDADERFAAAACDHVEVSTVSRGGAGDAPVRFPSRP